MVIFFSFSGIHLSPLVDEGTDHKHTSNEYLNNGLKDLDETVSLFFLIFILFNRSLDT